MSQKVSSMLMPQLSAKGSRAAGHSRIQKYREKVLPTPRPHRMKNGLLSHPSRFVTVGTRQKSMLPANKFRRHHAKKEMLRRALTPPVRRPSWRWWDFRPTPSRLSNMSMS